jgi:alkylation response protein AidB-like acyl-CoA dehydrogenase
MEDSMHLEYTPEQETLRAELRSYFAKLMTPAVRAKTRGLEGGDAYKQVIRQMGKDGWLGIGWPEEYGGQGKTATEQQIFVEEARRAGAPIPFVTLNTVGPALMQHGSKEHKAQYLPGIVTGEIHFAIGYSEPEAGTDLASLKTEAVLDGDHYVVNGTKSFTSGAADADYVWLACRTDPDVPKHKGITILIVPTSSPGFTSSPIGVISGGETFMTYYENVRVPVENVVGRENGGWTLITTQLNHERIGLSAFSSFGVYLLERAVEWARETIGPNDEPIASQEWVQANLAEAWALGEALRLMNARMGWELEAGRLAPADASVVKVYGTECLIEIYRLLIEVVGPAATLQGDPTAEDLAARLEVEYRACTINTFGGGVNEIQREIVAMLGLGLPRAAR